MRNDLRSFLSVAAMLFAAASQSPADAQGDVLGQVKISQGQGGFEGVLADGDGFGSSLCVIGDVDGDGIDDLAVGAETDSSVALLGGAVWILFLEADGTVRDEQRIAEGAGGLQTALGETAWFGSDVAPLGDLDLDGVPDLAVGARFLGLAGAVFVLFLNPDGTVKAEQRIDEANGGLTGPLESFDRFGGGLATLGDLDRDGLPELAVGASGDDDFKPNTGASLFPNRGAVWILGLERDGTVASEQKISDLEGSLALVLPNQGEFGASLAAPGDLDGDEVPDLIAGDYQNDTGGTNKGAVYVLYLESDGTVASTQFFATGTGGFGGVLRINDLFGDDVEAAGDLDGDGVGDLLVGSPRDDTGALDGGSVWILYLASDGSVASEEELTDGLKGFSADLDAEDAFGEAIARLGDLDGDGAVDYAIGAPGDDDAGDGRGAVYVLFSDGAEQAAVRPRNGSGTNPVCLTTFERPVLGSTWTVAVDTAPRPASALTTFVITDGPLRGIPTAFGELLVAIEPLGTTVLSQSIAPVDGVALHDIPVPSDLSLVGFPLYSQAILLGAGPLLCNGLDIVQGW